MKLFSVNLGREVIYLAIKQKFLLVKKKHHPNYGSEKAYGLPCTKLSWDIFKVHFKTTVPLPEKAMVG